jgi:asparagine synthetase B (glutamine-hydrolysing)
LKHETSVGDEYVTLCSTVLSLRGSTTVTQPYQDAHGNYILCWNGEAWSIDGKSATGNDTETIHGLLVDAITAGAHEAQLSPETGAVRVAHALSRVAGPYAFAFFDRPHGQIYLGRDFLGRRSLLTMATETGDLIVSSVSDPSNAKEWQELDADGIYGISLGEAAVNLQTPGLESRILGNYIATIAPYNSAMDTDDLVDVTRSVGRSNLTFNGRLAHSKVGNSSPIP